MPDTGVIHDIGYQRYEGPRLGRGYAARSLFVHGLRSAYGLGRSAWAKVLPVGVLAFASMASLVLVVVNTQLPEQVIDYVGIASTFTFAATVFVAVVAPELVSVDLRSNLLQLYLSRPLRKSDYALTKLASLTAATFLLFAIPMLIMFLGMAFNAEGIGGVFDELGGFAQGLVAAAIHAILLSALGLPLASLTGRRVFASGMIIALFLLTTPISGALQAFGEGTLENVGGMIDPSSLLNGVDQWLFGPGGIGIAQIGDLGPVYGLVTVVLTALGTLLLVLRYKKVKS